MILSSVTCRPLSGEKLPDFFMLSGIPVLNLPAVTFGSVLGYMSQM